MTHCKQVMCFLFDVATPLPTSLFQVLLSLKGMMFFMMCFSHFPPQGSKYSLLMLERVKEFCKGGDTLALNRLKKQENAMCGLRHFIPLRSL